MFWCLLATHETPIPNQACVSVVRSIANPTAGICCRGLALVSLCKHDARSSPRGSYTPKRILHASRSIEENAASQLGGDGSRFGICFGNIISPVHFLSSATSHGAGCGTQFRPKFFLRTAWFAGCSWASGNHTFLLPSASSSHNPTAGYSRNKKNLLKKSGTGKQWGAKGR